MAKKGEMKHVLDGKDVEARLDDVKYDFRKCGENIAMSDGASLKEIMKGWMDPRATANTSSIRRSRKSASERHATTRAKSTTPRTSACRSRSRNA